jgi:hypothetical protein
MEKITLTNLMKTEDVLYSVNEERNANWIGRILRRNCLLKQFIEGEIICVLVFTVCILFCMCMGVFVRCGCICNVCTVF